MSRVGPSGGGPLAARRRPPRQVSSTCTSACRACKSVAERLQGCWPRITAVLALLGSQHTDGGGVHVLGTAR